MPDDEAYASITQDEYQFRAHVIRELATLKERSTQQGREIGQLKKAVDAHNGGGRVMELARIIGALVSGLLGGFLGGRYGG